MDYSTKLKNKTVTNVKSSIYVQGVRLITLVTGNLLFTLYLKPQDFGYIAIAQTVIGLLLIFKDMGFSQPIIQSKRISKTQKDTIFWLNLFLTISLSSILFVSSNLIEKYFEFDNLSLIIKLMIVPFILNSSGSVHEAFLNRYLKVNLTSKIQGFSIVISYLIAIVMLLFIKDYRVIIIQQFVFSIVNLSLTIYNYSWAPGIRFNIKLIKPLYGFGFKLLIGNILNFGSRNVDNLLIGKFFGSNLLGQYNRAYGLLLLPLNQLNNPIGSALIPTLSILQDEKQKYKIIYLSTVKALILMIYPALTIGFFYSSELFDYIFGDKWSLSAQYFKILILGAFTQIVTNTSSWLLISQGRSNDILKITIFGSFVSVTSFLIGINWGVEGLIWAYTLTGIFIRSPFLIYILTATGPIRIRDFGSVVNTGLIILIPTSLIIFLIKLFHFDSLILEVAFVTIFSYGLSYFFLPKKMKKLISNA